MKKIKEALYLGKAFLQFYLPMKWQQFKIWSNYLIKKVVP